MLGTGSSAPQAITRWLRAWRRGDEQAPSQLLPAIYEELRLLAHGYLRGERTAPTLETAALVHEAYLKLLPQRQVEWVDRHHFYGIAAQAMRRLLIDAARRRVGAKRGGGRQRVPIDDLSIAAPARPEELTALDDALRELQLVDPEGVRMVELRFFAGLSQQAIAEAEGVSVSTLERRWRAIRAWLHHRLQDSER